ncbi:MAG: hypothetical protein BWX50_00814 [Euryarchaeota archaeon ADurb.Bin009]|nr:MAG: hypothetical protein BWX50_00814 [Euryarchaeota archaeon ADurb.Bin009]
MSPPISRSFRVRWPFRFERRRASLSTSSMALRSKWGIFPSFLTSWAMNRRNFFRFSGVSSIVSRM